MQKTALPSLLLRTLAVCYLNYYVFGLRAHLAWFAVAVLTLQTFWDWADYFYRRGRKSARAVSGHFLSQGEDKGE
jgi:hypothetical protein